MAGSVHRVSADCVLLSALPFCYICSFLLKRVVLTPRAVAGVGETLWLARQLHIRLDPAQFMAVGCDIHHLSWTGQCSYPIV